MDLWDLLALGVPPPRLVRLFHLDLLRRLVPLSLVAHLFPKGLEDLHYHLALLFRWDRLFPLRRSFHLALWVLVLRRHLLFPKGQQFRLDHSFHSVPLGHWVLGHRTLRDFLMDPQYLWDRIYRLVLLVLGHHSHQQFPMVPLYLWDRMYPTVLVLRWHLPFHLVQRYL